MMFVVFTAWYQRRSLRLSRCIDKHSPAALANYSVCITNLPAHVTSGPLSLLSLSLLSLSLLSLSLLPLFTRDRSALSSLALLSSPQVFSRLSLSLSLSSLSLSLSQICFEVKEGSLWHQAALVGLKLLVYEELKHLILCSVILSMPYH